MQDILKYWCHVSWGYLNAGEPYPAIVVGAKLENGIRETNFLNEGDQNDSAALQTMLQRNRCNESTDTKTKFTSDKAIERFTSASGSWAWLKCDPRPVVAVCCSGYECCTSSSNIHQMFYTQSQGMRTLGSSVRRFQQHRSTVNKKQLRQTPQAQFKKYDGEIPKLVGPRKNSYGRQE